jgi:hypothetical protein
MSGSYPPANLRQLTVLVMNSSLVGRNQPLQFGFNQEMASAELQGQPTTNEITATPPKNSVENK